MSAVVLTLPAPCKPLNANERTHWAAKAKRVRAWRARAYVAAIQAGRPKLDRAHVTVVVHATTNRKRDIANLHPTVKAAIDGIVADGGVLPGDDDAYLVGPDLRPGEKRDVFTLVVTLDPACGCGDCVARFGGAA